MTSVLAVMAKAPVAGRVKTRLCPPCTPAQAAALAEACLRDVLAAARSASAARRVVVLDGEPGAWLAPGFEVVAQRGDGLDERLAAAFADLGGGPALVVGMDTPQVTPALLGAGLRALERHDAVLGPAADGGYWAIGLRTPEPRALLGVPMSSAGTFAAQHAALTRLGLTVHPLPMLVDVDDVPTARTVAAAAPGTRFAAAARTLGLARAEPA